jgi:signal transduction histidine kinase
VKTFVRLRSPVRRRSDPRSRFRNRLLIGMVAVALLPLLAFAGLAALELDQVSRSTAQATQSAILQDQQNSQAATLAGHAHLVDARMAEIAGDLNTLLVAAYAKAPVASLPPTQSPPAGVSRYEDVSYASDDRDSLVLSAQPAPTDARFAAASQAVMSSLPVQQLRTKYPEINALWIADPVTGAMRTAPPYDVRRAVDDGRYDPQAPGVRAGHKVFADSQRRYADTSAWSDPTGSSTRVEGTFWTEPYPLLSSGRTGVSVWERSADGHLFGVDVSIATLLTQAVAEGAATSMPTDAYSTLLSSDGTVLAFGGAFTQDFPVPEGADPVGSRLPATKDKAFTASLHQLERTGRTALLHARLSGAAKEVFAAPVYGSRWLMVTTVPLASLEPELAGLTRGVTAGVHRLFPVMVLPVVILLLGLAFVAATLLSRRMVHPVQALADHAVLEERTRLAREIHDTLAQQLTGIVLELEAADTLIARGSDRARHAVEVARNLARAALQEARRSVWNLRPAPLAATGVIAAISQEVSDWQERTGVSARFRPRSVPARPAIAPAAEVALLRVVQEALTNVVRHSQATSVDVDLRASEGELVLTVHDNGIGFDATHDRPRTDCFGIDGMRERVNHAGGTLTVVGAPGNGSTVTARVPLAEAVAVAHTA